MTRPTWDQWGLSLARTVAERADCTRRLVGAVIMRPDHSIVSTGYNGGAPGGPSCLAGECPRGLLTYEQAPSDSNYDKTGCVALHAEQNALLRATWDEMHDSTLYCTDRPCPGCERMITGTPLARVVWPGHVARISNGSFLHFDHLDGPDHCNNI